MRDLLLGRREVTARPDSLRQFFCLTDVSLRLARDDERLEWDRIMDERHYLGFRQFAGLGLCHRSVQ